MTHPTRIRVVLVEDHPMYRDGLRAALESDAGVVVVGTAGDGERGVALACELRPDIVVMDLHLPGMSGVEATRQLAKAVPETRVLVLSMLDDDDSVFSAMRAGAHGYLLKGAGRDEALDAIRALIRGDLVFGAGVAQRVLAFFAGRERSHAEIAFPELTPRERDVLDRLARGDDNAAIAHRFGLSPKTVQNHVSSILNKLQVIDRSGAIVRARDAGLGMP